MIPTGKGAINHQPAFALCATADGVGGQAVHREQGTMNIKHINDIPADEVKAGTNTVKQVLISSEEGPHFSMRRFIMQPGGGMPNHTNTVEHEQYVLRGTAQIGIADKVYDVKQGNVVYIPPDVPHWYKTTSDEPFEFLCLVPNLPDKVKLA